MLHLPDDPVDGVFGDVYFEMNLTNYWLGLANQVADEMGLGRVVYLRKIMMEAIREDAKDLLDLEEDEIDELDEAEL